MLKNAGKKLGFFIKMSFYLSATAAFLIPMCILYNANSNDELLSLICIVCAFILPVILYILHLILYAFVELCENVFEIRKTLNDEIPDINEALFFIAKNLLNSGENDEKDINVVIHEEE